MKSVRPPVLVSSGPCSLDNQAAQYQSPTASWPEAGAASRSCLGTFLLKALLRKAGLDEHLGEEIPSSVLDPG